MADKMMRMAGRGKDGAAKAVRTDNDGIILSHNFRESYELITSAGGILIKAGSTYSLYLDNPPMEFMLSGLIANEGISTIGVSFQDAVGEKVLLNQYTTYSTSNSIFTTNAHKSKSNRIRIMLRNSGTSDITMSKLTAVSSSIASKETDVIYTNKYSHSDLFNYDDGGNVISAKNQKIMYVDTRVYSRVLMYLEHNFEVGFTLRVYDRLDTTQVFITAGFDGEKFTSGGWSIPIMVPASADSGKNYTVRYPIHIASELFNYPIMNLEMRLIPSGIQTRKLTDSGDNYTATIKIVGVK